MEISSARKLKPKHFVAVSSRKIQTTASDALESRTITQKNKI
jgi:hypothetical protein